MRDIHTVVMRDILSKAILVRVSQETLDEFDEALVHLAGAVSRSAYLRQCMTELALRWKQHPVAVGKRAQERRAAEKAAKEAEKREKIRVAAMARLRSRPAQMRKLYAEEAYERGEITIEDAETLIDERAAELESQRAEYQARLDAQGNSGGSTG